MLTIGKIYRLRLPGIAARVIEPPTGCASGNYPFLVQSLFLRSRWYVNERGEPDFNAPSLIVPPEGAGRRHLRSKSTFAVAMVSLSVALVLWEHFGRHL
jgi:hypothetical protein